ncbi:MAG: glycosyltransferase [Limisphaerales bacterium]
MKISVVIPAFNEEKLLAGSLAALNVAAAAFRDRGWNHETIVCDNNSTDRTPEIARAAGALVVFEPVNQIARARNRGASVATGDWILFLDADSHPSRELLADLAEAILDGRCLGGGATVRFESQAPAARLAGVWNFLSRVLRWAPGGFLYCRTDLFRELGGFSEELFVSEEIDFSRRLKRSVRRRGGRVTILHRHPLLTSDRKLQLYTAREQWAFARNFLLNPGKVMRNRDACPVWYDGRR